MFVDASALVAILTREPEGASYVEKIDEAPVLATSAIAIYEAGHALSRKTELDLKRSCELIDLFLDVGGIAVVPIVEEDGASAMEASSRYGKGSGHPARLNMGDCFSYAMAKRTGLPLLYKGDDFAQTDLA